MLEYLHVKNLALLEECELSFGPGLNILTGETGAGKSVLLGSVGLALGSRADREMIRSGSDEAYVELGFSVNEEILKKLDEMDISCEDSSVYISRKLSQNKNIFKINGEVSSAKQVKEIASLLLDIHGQHEHQSLLSNDRQLKMLDAYGKETIFDLSEKVSEKASEYSSLLKEYNDLKERSLGREREISLLKYECVEIENASLRTGEDNELEERYKRMLASEKLIGFSNEALAAISGDSGESVSRGLSYAIQNLRKANSMDESLNEICDKLADVEEIIGDVSFSLSDYIGGLEFEPEEFSETEERLNLINSLKARFGNSIEQILKYYDNISSELEKLENLDRFLNELSGRVHTAKEAYNKAAFELSKERKKVAGKFDKALTNELMALNFPKVSFETVISSNCDVVSNKGFDEIEFMISTNPGEEMRAMKTVASGGELSRIMLGIKTILAKEDSIDSLIFDEIDTGISGRTAWEVSKKLDKLAGEHQVIAITHLAQIAAMADRHYEIIKSVENGRTFTNITLLDKDGEIREIARLLGTDDIDEAALKNADELKQKAKAVKR